MAKYTIDYACGHGQFAEDLGGKVADRESKAAWLGNNRVCPECFRAAKIAEDATAPKTATIALMPAAEPVISIEASGQIEANKAALQALGYRWADAAGGLTGYLSMTRPKRVLALTKVVSSPEDAGAWISAAQASLAALGYTLVSSLSAIDMAYLAKLVAGKQAAASAANCAAAKIAEIHAADPRPAGSALRRKITQLEKASGARWNGKIYGRKGGWNFYIDDKKHLASDAEVADREAVLLATAAWDKKHAAEIDAAGGIAKVMDVINSLAKKS